MFEDETKLNPYAAAIMHYLKDIIVEVYQGDVGQTQMFFDHQISQKSIIRGKVVDAFGDCIVIECEKGGYKNRAYLNCWSIHNIVPVNEKLSIKDLYFDEEERKNKR